MFLKNVLLIKTRDCFSLNGALLFFVKSVDNLSHRSHTINSVTFLFVDMITKSGYEACKDYFSYLGKLFLCVSETLSSSLMRRSTPPQKFFYLLFNIVDFAMPF